MYLMCYVYCYQILIICCLINFIVNSFMVEVLGYD